MTVTITLPDGRSWIPKFVKKINQTKCIGCGRCYRVCGRDVLQLTAIDDDGAVIALDSEDDDEYDKKAMSIANEYNCIGCEACAKICPKKCYTHAPMAA